MRILVLPQLSMGSEIKNQINGQKHNSRPLNEVTYHQLKTDASS